MTLRRGGPIGGDALAKLAGLAFTAFGVVLVVTGILITIADLSGLTAVAFGLVLIGVGRLARRVFAPPEGTRAVEVSGYEASIETEQGLRGTRRQASIIHVDANATDAEVEAAKAEWLREQWQRRPDWVAGRIISQDERGKGLVLAAAVLWSALAVVLVVAAGLFGAGVGIVAAVVGIVAGALVVHALTVRLRRQKFGQSHLILERTPAFLGGVLSGEVESGVREDAAPLSGFHVRLRCVHRWEESARRGGGGSRTIHRRDVLWETEQWTDGRVRADGVSLSIPVRFELPADQPATTLPPGGEGIAWELEVSAEMDGLDYKAEFQVPVLPRSASAWVDAGSR